MSETGQTGEQSAAKACAAVATLATSISGISLIQWNAIASDLLECPHALRAALSREATLVAETERLRAELQRVGDIYDAEDKKAAASEAALREALEKAHTLLRRCDHTFERIQDLFPLPDTACHRLTEDIQTALASHPIPAQAKEQA